MLAIDIFDSFESRYWLIAAILSRLLVTTLIISSDYLIVDHFPGDDVAVFLVNQNLYSSLNSSAVEMALASFTKWDSVKWLTANNEPLLVKGEGYLQLIPDKKTKVYYSPSLTENIISISDYFAQLYSV